MKAMVSRLYANPKYAKAFHWGKLVTLTGSAQLIVQSIGLICGILVIRFLSPNEYGFYTLANTMLGTMVILADGGITIGVMSQAGRVWQDRNKLGAVLTTGLDLRKKFAVGSLLVSLPVLFYLLHHHGASWIFSTLIVLALIPAFFTSLSGTLLEIVPRLIQNISSLQKIQVGSNLLRLTLLGMSLIIFPRAFIAILAAGLPQIWANKRLTKLSAEYASINEQPDALVRTGILSVVKRTLPGAIFYCFSGQITIWIISVLGTTSSIAQVGALGRIAMVATLLSVLANTLITPRFARLPMDKSLLLKRYLQIQVALLLMGPVIVAIFYVFSTEALWILGPSYSHLKTELILNVIGGYLGFIAGTLLALNNSRGWTINSLILICLNVITMVSGILFIDVSTLQGLFIFNILLMATEVIIFSVYGFVRLRNIKQ